MSNRVKCMSILFSIGVAASVAAQTPDSTPTGMVAFFMGDTGTCPVGWKVPDLPQGRMIVGAASGSTVGIVVNRALRDRELPQHFHTLKMTFDLKSKDISGFAGSNNQGAKSGKHSYDKQTELSESGWGFTQLAVCEKQ